MAVVPTILVTSKDVDGPYRINEEDFDAKVHKKFVVAAEKAEAKAEKEAKK